MSSLTRRTGKSNVSAAGIPDSVLRMPHRLALPALSSRKPSKVGKDAPVFEEADIRGECRYVPDEYQNEELVTQHERFELYPMGQIADYPRHIPYNSDKKPFFERTNRGYLNVFQYNFKMPSFDTTFTILWDYNIGLVKVTPLFKCLGYSKTTPSKVIAKNAGLSEICHNITGGSLVAQGYWWPYEAAKAIALTFCWEIRYALTPLFGRDFPYHCMKPDDKDYGSMTVDSTVVHHCVEQARRYRELEPRNPPQLDSPFQSPRLSNTRTIRNSKSSRSGKKRHRKSTRMHAVTSGVRSSYGSRSTRRSTLDTQTQFSALRAELDGDIVRSPEDAWIPPRRKKARSYVSSPPTSLRITPSSPNSSDITGHNPKGNDGSPVIVEQQDHHSRTLSDENAQYHIADHWSSDQASSRAAEYLPEDERSAYLLMYLRFRQTST